MMEWNELIETGMKLIQMGCNSNNSDNAGSNCDNYCPFSNYCCRPGTRVDPPEWKFEK